MTRWYENPVKAWKERNEKLGKEIEETRPGDGPFLNYPTGRFFTRPFGKLMVIPEGYVGVREHYGKIGKVLESRLDPNGIETDDQGNKIKVTARDWPWGGMMKPGWHLMLSFFGAWDRIAVIDVGQQEMQLKGTNIMTADGVELPNVESITTYSIYDPARLVIQSKKLGKSKKMIAGLAEGRLASEIRANNYIDLKTMSRRTNLIYNADGSRYTPDELTRIGISLDGLYITKIDTPDELRDELSAQATARAKSRARVISAQADAEAAKEHEKVGRIYDASSGARRVYEGTVSREQGSGFFNVAGLRDIAEGLGVGFASYMRNNNQNNQNQNNP